MDMKAKQLVKNTLSNEEFFLVNKAILRDLNNANSAIILSTLISKHTYFENRGNLLDDSFFNTKAMLMEESGLSEQVILRAEKHLEKKGYMTSFYKGMPKVKYYTLKWEHISQVIHPTGTQQVKHVERSRENILPNNNHLITPNNNIQDNKNKEDGGVTSVTYEMEQMRKWDEIKKQMVL